jgi:coronin-1B/1C/6
MSRFVRASKFRHVFGQVAKKEECYDDLKVTRTAWDSNYVTGNPLYVAVILEAAGGGSFIVLPWSTSGKVDPKSPLITGHKGPVLDLDFNPFNDNLIASVSDDCTGKIWGIPEGGLKENLSEPLQTLVGHRRKVGSVKFSPTANNILATTSSDFSVKIWDIEKGKDVFSVDAQHTDIIQSADWNRNGSLLSTTCKDKKLRIIDPRANKIVQVIDSSFSGFIFLPRKRKPIKESKVPELFSLETNYFLVDSPKRAKEKSLFGILVIYPKD